MFGLFIVFLVIASKVLKDDNELNKNLLVDNKIQEQPIIRP
jgi:hypothetical protein